MAATQPFRHSSFFFGRSGSGRAAAAAANGAAAAEQPSDLSELEQALLDRADVDLECGYDDKFVFSWRRLLLHMGPGALMCIAYIDPGNLEADLQTGATTGYQLLWVLLWSTAMGGLLQSLAARLGVATGKHLAEHCREQYPPGVRHALWLMAEMAIIGSDIQEVIGTALALLLLSGGAMPLWAGVVVAAASAYLMLFLERLGVRYLEVLFELLIAVMSVSMGLLFFQIDIPYPEVLRGLAVPSLSRSAIPTACGLLGAIIMPHNLFLHSALVHSRPIEGSGRSGVPVRRSDAAKKESVLYYNIESGLALIVTLFINVAVISIYARGFFGRKASDEIGLANAGEYLGSTFGKQMAIIWGVGLLAAGQSSTMTGTYAGQWVMGGFLDLKLSTGLRMLVTRGVAICPTLFVALTARSDSTRLDVLNQWINILQSVQLPFAVIPLLLFTSDKRVMGSRFVNSRATTVTCWLIAASIIVINASTAYETLSPLVHSAAYLHAVFVAVVTAYVGFLTYLVLTPEGAQRLAATISRNVSRLSLLGSAAGNSSSGSLTAAGGGGQAAGEAEAAPLLPPPPSPFDQPQARPQQADDAGQANHAGQAEQEAEPTQRQEGRSGPAEGVAAADAEAEAAAPSGFVSGYVST